MKRRYNSKILLMEENGCITYLQWSMVRYEIKRLKQHKSYKFIYLSHSKNVLVIPLFSFNAEEIGFRSLPVSCLSSWIFNTLDGDDLLESSIINIQIIIIKLNLMMEYKIYMVVLSSRASRLFKYRRILSKVAFLTSLEYPPLFLISSIRLPNSTSILQNLPCCWSVLCSVKCFKHLMQKCFFSARL